jgi:putative ABC transport system permease protein
VHPDDPDMTSVSKSWGIALAVALAAYPRGFRRRFGDELRADFERAASTATTRDRLGMLATHVRNGLAERGAAVVRWTWWPTHRPHLYEPSGRRAMFWDGLRSDIRFTLRQAARAPAFTLLAVLALALGIGANSAVFSVVNGVLLRPLPYDEPERLVMVWSDNRNEGRALNVVSPANFADYRDRNRTFAAMDYALSFMMRLTVKGEEDAPPVWALRTGSTLLSILGREALLGRIYTAGERGVAVVSHAYWQNRLGGDPSAIGRTLTMSAEQVTIVGVMPPDFAFPYRSMFGPWVSGGGVTADMWIPMPFEGGRWVTDRGSLIRNVHSLVVVGRLAPEVSLEQARSDLRRVGMQLEHEFPDSNRGWGTTVVSLMNQTVGDVRPALLITLAGVSLILLMAAVNVANLVLARSVTRQRELAVRAALGASRLRLARQSLTESVILALAGAALGLLFVRWGVQALVALAPMDIPRMQDVSPDARVVLVTVAVAVAAGLFVGLLPAISMAGADAAPALQDHSRGSIGSRGRRRLRATLVVVEVALAVLLTIGAGLLIRSFGKLMNVDPGFSAESVLTLQMNIPDRLVNESSRQAVSADQRRAFYEQLLDRLAAIPGVVAVGGTTRIPLGSSSVTTSLQVEGRDNTGQLPEVEFRRVMRDFFQAMGTPVVRGRLFGPEDGPTAASAAVVNQTLARRIFGDTDPIGQHVRTGPSPSGPWITIVGVVADMRHASLDAEPLPEIYFDYRSNPPNSPFLALRTSGAPETVALAVRQAAREIDPAASLYDIQTMASIRATSVAEQRFLLILITAFGGLALLLASVGVYGVMTLVVTERTQEVGVRLALGAEPVAVLAMIVRQAMGLAALGVLAGVIAAFALAPLMASQLFGVGSTDPATFAAVPIVLVAVAAAAAFVPARRAMRIDPVKAIRYE